MSLALTAAEYFAGIGLVRLGLEPMGWRVVFANDIDRKKLEMYAGRFEDADRIYRVEDIHDLDPDGIPSTLLATASFPCIDLSIAGNQKGLTGRHSSTFWGFVRTLDGMGDRCPRLVLLENVLGWLTSTKGRDFREAISALNKAGYACDAFVLNAHHFTPQSRPRLFVVGARNRRREAGLEQKLASRPRSLVTKRLIEAILGSADLKWMALDLPSPPPRKHDLADLLEKLPGDNGWWWPEEKTSRLISQMSPRHLALVEQMTRREETSYATVYKRVRREGTRAEVRSDGIAGCLRTPVGGSSKQIVIAAGRGVVRARWMTAREYARLQGVPDSYPVNVPYLQALWGFGDAVCVPAVSWVARHALNPLAKEFLEGHD